MAGVHTRGAVDVDGVAGAVTFTAPGGEVSLEALAMSGGPFVVWIEVDGVAMESFKRRVLRDAPSCCAWSEVVVLAAGEHVVAVRGEWSTGEAMCELKVRHG